MKTPEALQIMTLSIIRSTIMFISCIEDEFIGIDKEDLSETELSILEKCQSTKKLFEEAKRDIENI